MPQLSLHPFVLTEPDRSQKKSSACQLCNKQFSITLREHLCKRCFRFVCDLCSPHKEKVYKANLQHRPHRLCNCCFMESEILKKYVENNKIVWGEDSELGKLWIKQFGGRRELRGEKKRRKIEYTTTALDLWQSLNYTFRQLIGRSVDQSKQLTEQFQKLEKKQKQRAVLLHNKILQQVLQQLSILMSQLPTATHPAQPQDLIYILIYFLAHCAPQNAIFLSKVLYQQVCSQTASIPTISSYLTRLQFSEIQIYKVQQYLQSHLPQLLQSATINYFNVQISIQIIGNIFNRKQGKNSHNQIERSLAYLINYRKQFIMKNGNQPQAIQIDFLRNNGGLGDGYKKFVKICQQEDFKTRQNSPQSEHYNNNDASSPSPNKSKNSLKSQRTYQDLLQQNEALKIMNKNQEEQIVRLKVELKKLAEKQKKKNKIDNKAKNNKLNDYSEQKNSKSSEKSYESFWEQIQEDEQNDSTLSAGEQQNNSKQVDLFTKNMKDNSKIKKLVKKRRPKQQGVRLKRNTTMSQTLIKQIGLMGKDSQKEEEQRKHKDILQQKNKQILYLKKQIQILQFSTKISEEDNQNLRKQQQQKQVKINDKPTSQSIQQVTKLTTENRDMKQEIQKMQEMNKQLLLKMKQLSNMLMDKEEEQAMESTQNFNELAKAYEQQIQDPNKQCAIF